MRSFAVIAGFAAAANAYAVQPVTNSTTPAGVPYKTPTPINNYPVSTPPSYQPAPVSYKTPEPYWTTSTQYGLTTYCATPTVVTYGVKTYTVTKPTTLIDADCKYVTSYKVTPTPTPCPPETKPVTSTPCPSSAVAPPVYTVAPPAPPKNQTYPTQAKPSAPPQFTGAAAAQAGVGLMAVVGAMAAFL